MDFVDHLPIELIIDIFAWVCQPTEFRRDVTNHTPPLALGAICSAWRQIAWATPELWRYIYIRPSRWNYEIQREILKDWLIRSCTQPLAIVFRLVEEGQTEHLLHMPWGSALDKEPFAEFLLIILLQEAYRWNVLEIDIPNLAFVNLLQQAASELINIRKLRIRLLPRIMNNPLLHFFESSIHLTHLYIESRFNLIPNTPSRNAECWKLHTLYVGKSDIIDIHPVLITSSPYMRHLHLELLFNCQPQTNLSAINFPCLETLVLEPTFGDGDVAPLFLTFRSMPNLRNISIPIDRETKPVDMEKLFGCIGGSLAVLRICLVHGSTVLRDGPEDDLPLITHKTLVNIMRIRCNTLRQFMLYIPSVGKSVGMWLKAFHGTLIEDSDLYPRIERYEISANTMISGPRAVDIYQLCQLPGLRLAQSWWATRMPKKTVGLTLKILDIGRQQVLKDLKEELQQGLQVEFGAPVSWGSSPVTWHLGD